MLSVMQSQPGETDEAFARRLQEEIEDPHSPPLFQEDTALQTTGSPQQMSNARANILLIFFFNFPQVIAAMSILVVHWNDTVPKCSNEDVFRWKIWSVVSAVRMVLYSAIILVRYSASRQWIEANPITHSRTLVLQHVVDAFGLVWFLVANLLVVGDHPGCHHPERIALYQLCLAMLILQYIQICLPCVIALLLLPLCCLCMPCIIRILARMQDMRTAPKGATEEAIEAIPVLTLTASHIRKMSAGDSLYSISNLLSSASLRSLSMPSSPVMGDHDSSTSLTADYGAMTAKPVIEHSTACPICLSDMAVGDVVRVLRCSHFYHKQCVDEWLHVNANCPTCRRSIYEDADGNSNETTPLVSSSSNSHSNLPGSTRNTHVPTNAVSAALSDPYGYRDPTVEGNMAIDMNALGHIPTTHTSYHPSNSANIQPPSDIESQSDVANSSNSNTRQTNIVRSIFSSFS